MSLANSLRAAIRTRVPEEALKDVLAHDRAVVENIILVLSEYTSLDIARTQVDKKDQVYIVSVPITADCDISLCDLRHVENFSPARIIDMRVQVKASRNAVCVTIGDETRQAMVAECDVVRVRKRRRWFSWGDV